MGKRAHLVNTSCDSSKEFFQCVSNMTTAMKPMWCCRSKRHGSRETTVLVRAPEAVLWAGVTEPQFWREVN